MARPRRVTPADEDLEIDLLIEAVRRRFGYDFAQYARASLKRRLRAFAQAQDAPSVSHLIPLLLHRAGFIDRFVNGVSVVVTEPFREPGALAVVREQVFPLLKAHGHAKLWIAGCASGEEVYSIAILLEEAGLLDDVQLYATDINTEALGAARQGIYSLELLRKAQANYAAAGGKKNLSDYYVAHYGSGKFVERLAQRAVFSQHNLATDSAFGEMQLIACRNVMIYFARALQERVVQLFRSSLSSGGCLALGAKESLRFIDAGHAFEALDARTRLYRAL